MNLQRIISKLSGTRESEFKSASYWDARYQAGGNSGDGSYGRLAEFKAGVINGLIEKYGIRSAVEFGCGDGHNLGLYGIERYIGLDVSASAIELCREKYRGDDAKAFFISEEWELERQDLSMSIDVIFHLVEQGVYENYMKRLFEASSKFVLIYSSNVNYVPSVKHVNHRHFASLVESSFSNWKSEAYIPNPFQSQDIDVFEPDTSFCDFYLFRKV